MAPVPVNNPPEDWVSPAERRRQQEANGHAENGHAVDDDPADATLMGDIVARDVVVLGPAYNAAQGKDICRRVAAGESLKQICSARGHPDLATVMGWLFLDEVEVFTSQYLNARSARLELMMDEVVAIADDLAVPPAVQPQSQLPTKTTDADADADKEKPSKPEPPAIPEKDRLAIAKLRIETRRWLIDKQLKAAPGTDTEETGRLVPSEILFDGVGA